MRLHSLTLTAFGAFGGSETIDFDKLAGSGLFLLHGPTGAGKTTVLDAVSFALFGAVAGVRSSGLGLRSHHGDPTTPTEVRLEVSFGPRRLRIVRRPRQLRPKRRGAGTIEDPPSAIVQELVAGSWVGRASRPTEADAYLQEHLHMGVSQFHQVVLLPQGDFARFLRASGDERRQVLENLFATQRFADVERWLRARADSSGAAVREADGLIRDSLMAAATVAELEAFPKDGPLPEAIEWMAGLIADATARVGATTSGESAARAAHRRSARAADAAEAVLAAKERLQRARETRADLDLLADCHTANTARRKTAQRAASVVPLIAQLTSLGARSHGLSESVGSLRRSLAELVPELGEADSHALRLCEEKLLGEVAKLADLGTDEAQLEERERGLSLLTAAITELDETRDALEVELAAIPAERDGLRDQIEAIGRGTGSAGGLEREVELLSRRVDAAVERDRLVGEVERATSTREEATRCELEAKQAWLESLETLLDGRVMLLARSLAEGEPCPVCGSAEHPDPATGHEPAINDDDVAAARETFDRAAALSRDVQETLTDLAKHLAVATTIAAGQPVESLVASLEERRQAQLRAAESANAVPMLRAGLAALDDRSHKVGATLNDLRADRAQLDSRRSASKALLSSDRRRVARARKDFASIADRAQHLDSSRRLIRDLVVALDELAGADEVLIAASALAEEEAARQGFSDITAAGTAALDDIDLAELTSAIEAHIEALAATETVLNDPDLLLAEAQPAVDIEALRSRAAKADRDLELASIEADHARKSLRRLREIDGQIRRGLDHLGPKLDTWDEARRLADLANGDDRQVEQRIRLSTYVLAARLEQVAAVASERLHRMSNGRYRLVHTDDAVDGRRKGGLGLRIVDAWTCTERETATLSGGESFFTSLALALAVADVVCAESGGVSIETMFVDEGFGSLDDETLQDVMDVMDDLRAGGRTIGIVSHVADLRSRISSQLEVVKTSVGSRLELAGQAPPDRAHRLPNAAA